MYISEEELNHKKSYVSYGSNLYNFTSHGSNLYNFTSHINVFPFISDKICPVH